MTKTSSSKQIEKNNIDNALFENNEPFRYVFERLDTVRNDCTLMT